MWNFLFHVTNLLFDIFMELLYLITAINWDAKFDCNIVTIKVNIDTSIGNHQPCQNLVKIVPLMYMGMILTEPQQMSLYKVRIWFIIIADDCLSLKHLQNVQLND